MNSTTIAQTHPNELPPEFDWRVLFLTLSMFALGADAFVLNGVLPVIAQNRKTSIGCFDILIHSNAWFSVISCAG